MGKLGFSVPAHDGSWQVVPADGTPGRRRTAHLAEVQVCEQNRCGFGMRSVGFAECSGCRRCELSSDPLDACELPQGVLGPQGGAPGRGQPRPVGA